MKTGGPTIAIIGAGIIGLSCAWELARRGAQVTIYDRAEPGQAASSAAAGMLAPTYEIEHNQAWFDLCDNSNRMWPKFATDLTDASGIYIEHHAGNSLAIARDSEEAIGLQRLMAVMRDLSGHCEMLSPRDAVQMASGLSGSITGAVLLPNDGWVNPRVVVSALVSALNKLGVRMLQQEVTDVGTIDEYDVVLIAAGAGAGAISGLEVNAVKGVILAYDRADFPLERVVRAGLEYAVPRSDITLFGATVGEVEKPVEFLKARAAELFPHLAGVEPIDHWAGYRPKLPDGLPTFGRLNKRTFVAAGHYRNGILLAPITAKILADQILDERADGINPAFSPDRFTAATP